MFREIRNERRALPRERAEQIMREGSHGVLAVEGDDGYPYAVPLSYAYEGDRVWFHCAPSGHKLDALARNPQASLCVVANDDVVPEGFTTRYASAIAFGRARLAANDDEKRQGLQALADKYCHQVPELHGKMIEGHLARTCVFVLEVEHLSAKGSKREA